VILFCSILSRSGSLYPATAIAPLRRRRFLECDDLEAKRAEEENVIKEYGQHPLDDCSDIAPETAERREGLMSFGRIPISTNTGMTASAIFSPV
jgi:hypothetical protein